VNYVFLSTLETMKTLILSAVVMVMMLSSCEFGVLKEQPSKEKIVKDAIQTLERHKKYGGVPTQEIDKAYEAIVINMSREQLIEYLQEQIEKKLDETSLAKLIKTKNIIGETFLDAHSRVLNRARELKKNGRLTKEIIEKSKKIYQQIMDKYIPLEGAPDVKRILLNDFEREINLINSGDDNGFI
jgi:hypothetical protein